MGETRTRQDELTTHKSSWDMNTKQKTLNFRGDSDTMNTGGNTALGLGEVPVRLGLIRQMRF